MPRVSSRSALRTYFWGGRMSRYIYIYIYIYICIYVYIFVCVYIYIYTYTYIHINIYIYIYIYICIYMHIYAYVYMCVYTYTHTETHTRTYVMIVEWGNESGHEGAMCALMGPRLNYGLRTHANFLCAHMPSGRMKPVVLPWGRLKLSYSESVGATESGITRCLDTFAAIKTLDHSTCCLRGVCTCCLRGVCTCCLRGVCTCCLRGVFTCCGPRQSKHFMFASGLNACRRPRWLVHSSDFWDLDPHMIVGKGADLVVHFPSGCVAKINIPWPWPWPWLWHAGWLCCFCLRTEEMCRTNPHTVPYAHFLRVPSLMKKKIFGSN
jgi:hypothetical protein